MKYILIILISILLFSCNNTQKRAYEEISETNNKPQQAHPGKKLMETNCYVCHSPSATMKDRIAPPMVAVKMHYISEETTKEEFLKEFTTWMKEPSEKNSKMPGAIRKFGVMPYQSYPEDVILKIGEYIYEYDIEQPAWFEDHFNEEHEKGKGKGMRMKKGMGNTESLPESHEEKGLEIALATKGELGKNLMGKIQKEGVIAALDFCNIKAYPITDSMALVHKATIKRVSNKYRNPNNKANNKEVSYIQKFQQDILNKKETTPIIDSSGNSIQFYYPIVTNDMCLKCHGIPNKTIASETFTRIKQLYPSDLATGYEVNEVRGIWSIKFQK